MTAKDDAQKMAFAEAHSERMQQRRNRIPPLPRTYTLDDKERRKLESLARTYKPDEQMDALEKMKAEHSEQYARMSPQLKMALGGYIAAREAFEQVGA